MTKVWDDVKQEACRLYLSGAPLSHVQNELRIKYKFKASARSFRLKFKEWGITRASQLRELQSHERGSIRNGGIDGPRLANPAPEIHLIPERSLSEPLESPTITTFDRSPITSSATLAPSPLSLRIERDHPPTLSPRSAVSRDRTPSSFNHALEDSYVKLQQAQSGDDVTQILVSLPFVAGEDYVIHLAAARAESWALDYILDYMRVVSLNIDIEDSKRHTALESAILRDRVGAVEILLEGEASVIRRNEKEQMPLHLAVQACSSVDIVKLLLQYGADAEAPLSHRRGRASTPVYLAFERLQQMPQHDPARHSLCSMIELLLRSHVGRVSNDTAAEPNTMAFLENWVQCESFSMLSRWNAPTHQFRLSHFLRNDCNPLCWLPRNYCPNQECKSLASFVFAHTSGSGLPELLLRSTDVSRFGRHLLYCLLSPCTGRVVPPANLTTRELIDELLGRMDRAGVEFQRDPSILRQILRRGPELEKLTLIQLVHFWDLITVEESKEVLKELSLWNEDFRLHLTEILFSLPGLAPPDFWTNLMVQNFSRAGRMYSRQGPFNEQTRIEFQEKTLLRLGINPSDVSSTDSVYLIQCVMHYWTKKLLEGDTFDYDVSNQQRVFGAVQSRQKYALPPLPVPGDLVLSMFPHLDPRNRGGPITSAPGRSDGPSPPDSTLGAELSDAYGRGLYGTPASHSG